MQWNMARKLNRRPFFETMLLQIHYGHISVLSKIGLHNNVKWTEMCVYELSNRCKCLIVVWNEFKWHHFRFQHPTIHRGLSHNGERRKIAPTRDTQSLKAVTLRKIQRAIRLLWEAMETNRDWSFGSHRTAISTTSALVLANDTIGCLVSALVSENGIKPSLELN